MGTKKPRSKKRKTVGAAKTTPATGTRKSRKAAKAETEPRRESHPTATRSTKAKVAKNTRAVASGHMSALDAAAKILAGVSTPMRATEMIEQMEAQGLWKSPGGKTPAATLYAAMMREIAAKGVDARFRRIERGLFTHAGSPIGINKTSGTNKKGA